MIYGEIITIAFNELAITEHSVVNANELFTNGLLCGDTLEADAFDFEFVENGEATISEIMAITKDEPVLVVVGEPPNDKKALFYVDSIERLSKIRARVSCLSYIGLLSKTIFKGDIYEDKAITDVIAEIEALLPTTTEFQVNGDLEDETITNWIPYTTGREALQQLMLAKGFNARKVVTINADDTFYETVNFEFLENPSTFSIEKEKTSIEGRLSIPDNASVVRVTEHAFFQETGTETKTLFDNSDGTNVVNALVVFSEPQFDLQVRDSLVINESGANYAIVSGKGRLGGKAYTHTQKVLEADTGIVGNKEVEITDGYLINAGNSSTVLHRLVKYYSRGEEYEVDIVPTDERVSDYVEVYDAFDVKHIGHIKSIEENVSKQQLAKITVASNWTPSPFGDAFDSYFIITSSGTATFPADVDHSKSIRLVLIGGGNGGEAGESGGDGEDGEFVRATTSPAGYAHGGAGGIGGIGGNGGDGGKVLIQDITTESSTITTYIGAGGVGGSGDDAATPGEATTVTLGGTTYTSATGISTTYGYASTFTNIRYGQQGDAGYVGGNGGKGGDGYNQYFDHLKGDSGTSVASKAGGAGGTGRYNYSTDERDRHNAWLTLNGGGGSGATFSSNGNNGQNVSILTLKGGNGGNGIQPTKPSKATRGNGGQGGHGGSGAGGGGACFVWNFTGDYEQGYGGVGGAGGAGGDGGDGAVIVMYKRLPI